MLVNVYNARLLMGDVINFSKIQFWLLQYWENIKKKPMHYAQLAEFNDGKVFVSKVK